jgi:hypothetical protein
MTAVGKGFCGSKQRTEGMVGGLIHAGLEGLEEGSRGQRRCIPIVHGDATIVWLKQGTKWLLVGRPIGHRAPF